MKGYLIDKDGTQYQLPELLSWDVCHGTGEPCDYFEVKMLYTAALLPSSAMPCALRAQTTVRRCSTALSMSIR